MNDIQNTTPGKKFPINGFKQLKAFWNIVEDGENVPGITAAQIAFYCFLINYGNTIGWKTWMSIPRESIMSVLRIKNKKTYYKDRDALRDYGLIEIRKGVANKTAAQFKLVKL